MATISTEKVFLRNTGEVKKVITYSGGMFRIKLPQVMSEGLNIVEKYEMELRAHSESEVNDMFFRKVKEWENAVTYEQKIILFESKFQGALLKEEYWEAWDDGKYAPYSACGTSNSKSQGCWHFFESDIAHDYSGLGLMINWGVFNKKTINNKSGYKYLHGRGMNDYHYHIKDYTEIPWTEEREQFFLNLDEQFARMIAKVHKALGELTPEKLLLLTDSGTKLLG